MHDVFVDTPEFSRSMQLLRLVAAPGMGKVGGRGAAQQLQTAASMLLIPVVILAFCTCIS